MELNSDLDRLARARQLGPSGAGRALRRAAGLSLQDVAQALGVSISALSRWERAERRPRRDAALAWLATLERVGAA
jgi:transcriptional regulator with XRE-family HTH domain